MTFFGGAKGADAFQDRSRRTPASASASARIPARRRSRPTAASSASRSCRPTSGRERRGRTTTSPTPGFEVVRDIALQCPSWTASPGAAGAAAREADRTRRQWPDVDAIVQVGTNLSMVRLAAAAEMWLGKPVIAINTATYWHALRQNKIADKIPGLGRLLESSEIGDCGAWPTRMAPRKILAVDTRAIRFVALSRRFPTWGSKGNAVTASNCPCRGCPRNCKRRILRHHATGLSGPGKATKGGDPRARRPAVSSGHARACRSGCTDCSRSNRP